MPVLQPKAGHFGLILPLCTSSATVGLALFQYPVLGGFLTAQPSIAGKPLSTFWAPMVKQGAPVIALSALTSAVAGVVSARWLQTHQTLETTDVSGWYTWGAVLAAGHFAFLPLVAPLVKKMIDAGAEASGKSDDEVDKENRVNMKTWFLFHTARTLLVDIPALACFAEGAALSFWVI